MSAQITQDELQERVLERMFDLANQSAQRVSYRDVAKLTDLPEARVAMALKTLEGEKLLLGAHGSAGSAYTISEFGYREVEKNRLAPGHHRSVPVPASDRVVTLSDNQRDELESAASEIISGMQAANAVDGDVELKERFIAQISAARELVRSQSVRAYLFYQLVVEVLARLISTYGKTTLGVAAAKLLEIYIEHLVKG
jgi:hypothetical protein